MDKTPLLKGSSSSYVEPTSTPKDANLKSKENKIKNIVKKSFSEGVRRLMPTKQIPLEITERISASIAKGEEGVHLTFMRELSKKEIRQYDVNTLASFSIEALLQIPKEVLSSLPLKTRNELLIKLLGQVPGMDEGVRVAKDFTSKEGLLYKELQKILQYRLPPEITTYKPPMPQG